MKKIKVFFTALVMLLSVAAFAQTQISGTVLDSAGDPVPGANVLLKGSTTVYAMTDAQGAFKLSVPADGVLVVNCLGFITQEIEVAGKTQINVVLESDAQTLEETIVVAYGTATKSSFTGSAAVVKSEEISKKISSNVTSALAGTAPGVQIINASGDPTSNAPTIRIRGIGSMSASSAPLIVVDGVPYEGSISDINPNDVESMSVLKDASASAIYGHRGANGVVLITTKKGSGEAQVKFDGRWGVNSRLIPQYDVITNPAEYYETHYKMMYNSEIYAGKTSAEAYAYADKNLLDQNNGGLGYLVYTVPEGQKLIGTNFKLNPNATLGYSDGEYYYTPDDWYKEAFHNAFRQEYNISVSGSKDRFNYFASVGFLDDRGMVSNSDYKRYTARINADYQAKKWIKILTNMTYSQSDSQVAAYTSTYGSSGNIFYIANNMGPIYPLYVRNADGSIKEENGRKIYDANQTNFKRPWSVGNAVRDNEYDSQKLAEDMLIGKWGVILTPVKGLSISANVGVTADNERRNELYTIWGGGSSSDGLTYVSHERLFSVNQQYLVEYKTDFGGSKHHFDILAGFERYSRTVQVLYGQNDHLFNPTIGELSNADGSSKKVAKSYTNRYMTQGILARAQYDYNNKLYVSASYRHDSSSRFAKGHRWGDFGSVGAAWVLGKDENDFLADIDWIDSFKIKASYGVQGNDNLGSYYPYSDQYTHSYNEDSGEYSLSLSYKGNEELTWETSRAFNAGVEFEFFGGYLNGDIEYFSRKTVDLLFNKDVPLSSGNPTGEVPTNVGSIVNRGFEATLDGKIIRNKNIDWTWNLNLTHYTNKILSLDPDFAKEGIRGSNFIYEIDGSLYQAYMRKYAGVNRETGKAQYYKKVLDANGKETGKTEITEVFSEASQFDLGSVLPKLFGGFGMSFRAYGIDLSAQFSFQLGGKYYDGSYQALMHTNSGSQGQAWHRDILKSWSEDNPDSNIPRLDGDTTVGQTAVDRFLVSSNYLSINNITLGYTFPEKWMQKIRLSSLRIYVAGENLAVATARKGIDPRYSMGLGSYTSGSGLNTGSYGTMRNITGGITLTF